MAPRFECFLAAARGQEWWATTAAQAVFLMFMFSYGQLSSGPSRCPCLGA